MRRRGGLFTALIAVIVVLAAACSDGDAESTTTTASDTTTESSVTSSAAPTGTGTVVAPTGTQAGNDDTTPTEDGFEIPEYSIEAREVSASGDTVVVLLVPGTYSDLDLENVVADVVQRFAPIATVHVVDDREAVELVLGAEDVVEVGGTSALDEHYFARLEEGFRLVFEGPFGELPEVILGS